MVAEFLDNDRSLRRFGYGVIAVLFGFGGIWAAFIPIDSAALAVGVVQVEGKRKPVQHLEGGIIASILVANGDSVSGGQPLLLLDAAKDRAEQEILVGRLFNSKARMERLQAERDDAETLLFSDFLQSQAESDSRANNAIASELTLFLARLADRRGEEEVVRSQQRGLIALSEAKRAIVESLEKELSDLEELLQEGYVDKQRLRELERGMSGTLGELSELEVAIDEAELKILQLRKRFKTQVVDELTLLQEELHDQEQQYAAVRDRVVRATITSPVAGIVQSLKPNTIGAVIAPREVLLEVVPEARNLIVDAQVSPMDIDRVRIGQSAEVRFSVFKDAYLISGTLVKLSADRIVEERSEYPYYAAEIKLFEEDLKLLNGMSLIPGMPAEVLIKTGERTMLSYITSPMNRLFSRSLIED